jgi:hypothetical protein
MELISMTPRLALNKAFLKVKPNRQEIEHFNDTSFLESQIDQLVYELYGLTEEEIKIVEGN